MKGNEIQKGSEQYLILFQGSFTFYSNIFEKVKVDFLKGLDPDWKYIEFELCFLFVLK